MQQSSLLGHTQEVLQDILRFEKPADVLLDSFFRSRRYLGSHDRRFIAETTYGVLRHFRLAAYILERSLTPAEADLFDEDRILLLVSAYLSLNGSPSAPAAVHVLPRVKSDRLKDRVERILAAVTANARDASVLDAAPFAVRHSYPDWMMDRLVPALGKETTEQVLRSLNEAAPLTIRANSLKGDAGECRKALEREGVATEPARLSPVGLRLLKRVNVFSLNAFRDGMFEVQDEGSQILPLLIDPKPTAKVLDACAGAGGKTLEFSAIMKNRGEIMAADVNAFRLEELRKRSRRAGASNIRIKEVDALTDLESAYKEFFDIVFVDAPCSGLGTVRRNPGMKWSVTPEGVEEIVRKQRSILQASSAMVKPGGRLSYATCTLLPDENERVVEEFVGANPAFRHVDPRPMVDRLKLPDAADDRYIRLLPHIHGTDGFFCAVLERVKV